MDNVFFESGPLPRPGHRVLRSRFYAWRINTRVLAYCGITLVLLILLATWAMTLGSFRIPFTDVANELLGRNNGTDKYATQVHFIVHTLRLPRVLCAILIGAFIGFAVITGTRRKGPAAALIAALIAVLTVVISYFYISRHLVIDAVEARGRTIDIGLIPTWTEFKEITKASYSAEKSQYLFTAVSAIAAAFIALTRDANRPIRRPR